MWAEAADIVVAHPLGGLLRLRVGREHLEPRTIGPLLPLDDQSGGPLHLAEVIAAGSKLHVFVVHPATLAQVFERALANAPVTAVCNGLPCAAETGEGVVWQS